VPEEGIEPTRGVNPTGFECRTQIGDSAENPGNPDASMKTTCLMSHPIGWLWIVAGTIVSTVSRGCLVERHREPAILLPSSGTRRAARQGIRPGPDDKCRHAGDGAAVGYPDARGDTTSHAPCLAVDRRRRRNDRAQDDAYLRYRAKGSTDTMFRGMLLHLAWWMELGAAIRAAALS